jgi:hypothetical protein
MHHYRELARRRPSAHRFGLLATRIAWSIGMDGILGIASAHKPSYLESSSLTNNGA